MLSRNPGWNVFSSGQAAASETGAHDTSRYQCRAIDALRRRVRDRAAVAELQLTSRQVSNGPGPEAVTIEAELAERLRHAIAELSDHEANVFSMSCLQALANHEIATTLGVSASNISSTLHKAREKLRGKLSSFIEPNATEKS